MSFKFYSVTTLPAEYRKCIHQEMCHENGGMHYALKYRMPKQRLALMFNRKRLVCWATVSLLGYMGDMRPYIGAWTVEEHRRKGYAQKTVLALLEHLKMPQTEAIRVYRKSMYKLVRGLGYRAKLCTWDVDDMELWMSKFGQTAGC